MNVKRLREALARMDDDDEILVWTSEDEVNRETYELTIDTDMRSGETKLVICADQEAGNLRDYEHHPAYEDINAWIYEEGAPEGDPK